jgi:hypothetical protein
MLMRGPLGFAFETSGPHFFVPVFGRRPIV